MRQVLSLFYLSLLAGELAESVMPITNLGRVADTQY
jgi:hypothetical protein